MILFDLIENESHPVYQELQVSNNNRQYDFLLSIVKAAIDANKPYLSGQVIKALNYHAITCLHPTAGEYRPWLVGVGTHEPANHFRVAALMDDFINHVNRIWCETDTVLLAAYILWRLNYIHPFINGNGRTARAICYFVICLKSGGFLPGTVILPELIRREREKYIAALVHADGHFKASGEPDLTPLYALLIDLLKEQVASSESNTETTDKK